MAGRKRSADRVVEWRTSMELGAIRQPDFEAMARQDGTAIQLALKGDASGDALEALEKLLVLLHKEAIDRRVTEAAVDIRELEFMSSACFKCLVTWVTDIQSLDSGKHYLLRFLSNPKIGWQKRSLRSLHCFAVDLVKIED
jgi:hypothetical protein